LSLSKKKQDEMTRLRTAFTFGSQLISLLLSLLFFALIDDKFLQYSLLTLTCVGLGIITTAIFLIFCNEITLSKNIKSYYKTIKKSLNISLLTSETSDKPDVGEEGTLVDINDACHCHKIKVIDFKYWMRKSEYYAYMAVYMFVRMAINVSSCMIPFFCKNILQWNNSNGTTPIEIAILIIICNCGSVLNSVLLEGLLLGYFHMKNHRVVTFLVAVTLMLFGCLPLFFLGKSTAQYVYYCAFFIGIAFSLGLSGASALINDVVGSKGAKGAFVYGSYSFADKLSCGVLMFFMIQIAEKSNSVLRLFMSLFPPFAILCALILVFNRRHVGKFPKEEDEKELLKLTKKYTSNFLDNSILSFK